MKKVLPVLLLALGCRSASREDSVHPGNGFFFDSTLNVYGPTYINYLHGAKTGIWIQKIKGEIVLFVPDQLNMTIGAGIEVHGHQDTLNHIGILTLK